MVAKLKNSGIFAMFVASVIFSFSALLLKVCSPYFDLIELVFFRSLVGVTYFLVYFKIRGINPLGNRRNILLLRGFFGFCGLSLYYFTIRYIPLADTVVLNRLSPIFVIILSAYLLDERITKKHFYLAGLAFAGVMLIAKPESSIMQLAALTGVGSAIASALAYIAIKKASVTEHVSVIVFYFFAVALVLSTPFAGYSIFVNWQQTAAIAPKLWLAMLGMIALSITAQLFMTRSYSLSQAGKASLVTYISVFSAAILAYLFFQEIPDSWSIFGGLLILLATGLVSTIKTRQPPASPKH